MELYSPDHFRLQEFIPEVVFNLRGNKAWELLNPALIYTWDELRKRTGHSCSLNNWHSGGNRNWQGLRIPDYYGGKFSTSQHPLGNAGDGYVHRMTVEEVIHFIVEEKKKGSFQYLTGIELGVTWVHLDTRPSFRLTQSGLFFFDKKGIVEYEGYVWPVN
jgi:hypothetical protein